MAERTRLIGIDEGEGIPLSDALLARLGWAVGDELAATVTETSVVLTKRPPEESCVRGQSDA